MATAQGKVDSGIAGQSWRVQATSTGLESFGISASFATRPV